MEAFAYLPYVPYLVGGTLMLLHPWGRKALWWMLVVLPLAIVALMILSEPDLGD
jgi:hypothetical protein